LHERLSRAFPDVGGRVQFVPRLGFADFVNLLRVADVVLDPLHFGGGNSNYEAFALGVPIVTRPGRFMRGRVTYACYRQMGVADCVAESDEEYVRLALRLANDREWHAEVTERIRAHQHELFEDEAAVRELEGFFERSVAAARVGRRLAEVDA
jgi:predicted O-linked N-acetylglucosamine transferase (SPINDLY family)